MVLQLTVFWYIGAVLGHVCLGLGVLAWGPCCSVGFSFSPNGALEFVLFCGRLAVAASSSNTPLSAPKRQWV